MSRHAFAAHFWSERYIRQIEYIFCIAFVDFVSADVAVVSSLKRFKKSFSFVFHIPVLITSSNMLVRQNAECSTFFLLSVI